MAADRMISVLAFVLLCGTVTAQNRQQTQQGLDLPSSRDRVPATQVVAPPAPAMESVLNPEHYIVGPSDGFGVNVWTDPPLTYRLTVTPEGTLIIPGVGEIVVAGLPLSEARARVLTEMRKRFRFGESSVTLVSPRSVVVSVQGRVVNPGTFVLPAYSRIDKALEEANKLQLNQNPDELRWARSEMSTRRVIVRHADGTESRADLRRFMATQDDNLDPYLREGDIIVVPKNDFGRNVFGVYGEVNAPGRYEYAEGDGVKGALQIAFGFTPRAIQDSLAVHPPERVG